jgi:hypothetical protein
MAAANLAVSITARTAGLESGLRRASSMVSGFQKNIATNVAFGDMAGVTTQDLEEASRAFDKIGAASVSMQDFADHSFRTQTVVAALRKTALLAGSDFLLLSSRVGSAGLALTAAFASVKSLGFAGTVSAIVTALGGLPIILGTAAVAVVGFTDKVAGAVTKMGQWVGLFKEVSEAERMIAATTGVQARLDKMLAAKESQIEALKKRLFMLKHPGAGESEFMTGQAKGIQLQIEAEERGAKFAAAQKQAAVAETNRINALVEANKALGARNPREAAEAVSAAANQVKRMEQAQRLMREQVPLIAKEFGVAEEAILKRLGFSADKTKPIAERAEGTAQAFATGRFKFGPGAMGGKAQKVEDPQLKESNKHLGEIARNTKSSGSVWR